MRLSLFLTLLLTLPLPAEPLPKEFIRRFPSRLSELPRFSADEIQVLPATADATARWVYEKRTGILRAHAYGIIPVNRSIRFDPRELPFAVLVSRDDRFALADHDTGVALWDIPAGRLLRTLPGIRLNPDAIAQPVVAGDFFAFESNNDPKRLRVVIAHRDPERQPLTLEGRWIGFADRGTAVVVNTPDRLTIVDPATGKERRGMAHVPGVKEYVAAPTGDFLLALTADAVVRVDLGTLRTTPIFTFGVASVSISQDGKRIFAIIKLPFDPPELIFRSLEDSSSFKRLDFPSKLASLTMEGHWEVSSDGRFLTHRKYDFCCQIDVPSLSHLRADHAVNYGYWSRLEMPILKFRGDDTLLCLDEDRILQSRSIGTGKIVWSLELLWGVPGWKVTALSRDDRLLVTTWPLTLSSPQSQLVLISETEAVMRPVRVTDLPFVKEQAVESHFIGSVISKDSDENASYPRLDLQHHVLNFLSHGREAADELHHGDNLARWLLRAAGETFLAEADGNCLRLYDLRDNQPFAVLNGTPTNVALSPNGKRLAVSGEDGSVTVWDFPALRARKPFVAKPLSAREWSAAWNDLRSHFTNPALMALRALELDPDQTLREVPRRMPVAVKLDPKAVQAAFDRLNHPETRPAAWDELASYDLRIKPFAERHLLTLPAGEASQLATRLAVESGTVDHHANRQAFRTIELLNRMRADDLLRQYADGDPEAILTMEAKHALEQRR